MNENVSQLSYHHYDANIDDSIKPSFRVFWINKFTAEKGNSTFFTYSYGIKVIRPVFEIMYPKREILSIVKLNC